MRARARSWRARVVGAAGLTGLWVSACAEPEPASERWPLPALRLPSLSCLPAVESRGECARDADCEAGQACVLDPERETRDREPLALSCGSAVGAQALRSACDEGAECESGVCGLGGVCLAPCREDEDCPLGQACQPVEARIAGGLAPLQACAQVAAFAPDVSLALETLEPLQAATLATRPVSAEGAVSAFFLLGECGATLRITHVAEPDSGRVLFDLAAQLSGRVQPNPVVGEGALLPVLIPNNPRLSLSPRYDIRLRSDVESSLRMIRAARTEPGKVLDLNLFYVGGGEREQAGGLHPGDAAFEPVIERFGARCAEAGLTLGEVHEVDVTGALREELSELEVRSVTDGQGGVIGQEVVGLDRLNGLSAGLERGGLNVFLVRGMGPLRGIAGGTPGALGLLGSSLSGLALALDTVGLAQADRAMFHEAGHQLGLFHTSEHDGSSIEPLRDTPMCGADQDLDADGTLRASECAEHGADNLMFWEGTGDALSAEQAAILTRALLLR
jgi:hypothetical protein